jgi:DUF4097 and DUF4098 domain-containing protein YvlB
MTATSLLLVAALLAPAQDRPQRAPETDQTVPVTRGARLSIENFAGEVTVRAWDRDTLRVQARHGSRAKIDIRNTPASVTITAEQNAPNAVDYEISAPAWMAVRVSGTYIFISIEGMQGAIVAETTQGDVVCNGGTGTIRASSIMGQVTVDGARGRVTASSVNDGVRIANTSGDVSAETSNGNIELSQVTSSNVEVNTINGHIQFEGPIADRGRYRFTTHNGGIRVAVPENSNATFTVRTYQGRFSSSLKLNGPPASEVRRGRRTTYTLGSGGAEMELESFGGSIVIGPPGTVKERTKGKVEKEPRDHHEAR